MTDKEKFIQTLIEIGVSFHEWQEDTYYRISITNDNYDVEERAFVLKFDIKTGKYFEWNYIKQ